MSNGDEAQPPRPDGGSAEHVIAGFRYQLLQSVVAWIELRDNEELWLEISEDFSIASKGESTDVQVKNSQAATGPPAYSLQSEDIRAALRRFWARVAVGGAERRLVFLSQGGAGKERGHVFPDRAPGLLYWRAAAIGSDTGPIRAALKTLFAGEPLGQWLETNPDDDELRSRLLRRVQWALEASSAEGVTEQVHDQVASIYLAKNLPAMAAGPATRSLIDRAFETAAKPKFQDRRLNRIELHRVLEETAITMRLGDMMTAGLPVPAPQTNVATFDGMLVAPVAPPPRGFSYRTDTVDSAIANVSGQPVMWVHGAHGVGKSTLARLIALRLGGAWLQLDLRPVQKDTSGSLRAWRDLLGALTRQTLPTGIIIDDFADEAGRTLLPRLAALVRSSAARGARVIVTSPQPPSASLLSELEAASNAAIQAPYLSQNEVTELIKAPVAPPDDDVPAWAVFIHASTGGGHPTLTASKVSSLRARGWPVPAMLEDFAGSTSEAIRQSRDGARQQLLRELSVLDAARSLDAGVVLRRIACAFGRVDDALVRRLITAAPPLQTGGDSLAILRGSWLELLPDGDYRVSPLLGDITSDMTPADIQHWQRLAAEHWLGTRLLNERSLPLCFWNAFLGQHDAVLLKLSEIIQLLPEEKLRGAAAILAPITALATDRPFYPNNAPLSAHLRLLQFEVAAAVDKPELAGQIAARLLNEVDAVPNEDHRALLLSLAGPKVLMSNSARLTAGDRVAYALRVRSSMSRMLELGEGTLTDPSIWLKPDLGDEVDMAGFLFASSVQHIKGAEDLLELVEALDAVASEARDSLINAISQVYKGHGVLIHSGWSRDQVEGRDLHAASTSYDRIEAIVTGWSRPELIIEVICARSVILDEGLNLPDDAIRIIDDAITTHGPQPPLLRQKAKVLSHGGRDAEATDIFLAVEDAVGTDSELDRALAMRDGGLMAARAGRFRDAVRMFNKAEAALRGTGINDALVTGIMVERSLAEWKDDRRGDAVVALADALDAVELFSSSQSRQAERAHQLARAMVGYFWGEMETMPSTQPPQLRFGQASALAGSDEELQNIDLKPLADNWRILASVEFEARLDVGIQARSLGKQGDTVLVTIESLLAIAKYGSLVELTRSVEAMKAGVEAVSAMRALQRAAASGPAMVRAKLQDIVGTPVKSLVADPLWRDAILRLPVDQIILRGLGEGIDPTYLDGLERDCAIAFGDASIATPVLKAATGLYAIGGDAPFAVATVGAFVRSSDDIEADPAVRFHRDLMMVGHLTQSFARRSLEAQVFKQLAAGWARVLDNQRFRLRHPSENCPVIEEAIAEMTRSGMKGAARLILAAALAVGQTLSPTWEDVLSRVAKAGDKS